MSASALRQRLSKTASSWPVDPFRPHLQLKNFLESLASHPNLTPRAVEASEVLSRNAIQQKACFFFHVAATHTVSNTVYGLPVFIVEEDDATSFDATPLRTFG